MAITPTVTSDGYQTTSISSGGTSGNIALPATPSEGQLIVVVLGGFASWSGDFAGDGFTEIHDSQIAIYAKKAGASEDSNAAFANKLTNQYVEAVAFLVDEGTWHDTGDLTDAFAVATTATSLNCPLLNTGWGDIEALWSVVGYSNYGNLGAGPTDWNTNGATSFTGNPNFIYCGIRHSDTDLVSEEEDPGSWTGSGSTVRSNTFAIRGAAEAPSSGLFFGPGL